MKQRKSRNPVARALRAPRFHKRVVGNRKLYSRKGRSTAIAQRG